jgi:hypothetical protein
VALALLAGASCRPSATPATTRAAPGLAAELDVLELVGTWRWLHRTAEPGVTRVEDERWRFAIAPGVPDQLVGRYLRDVDVRATDDVPFTCDQRTWYRQRASFDVTATLVPTGGLAITETGYRTEPSPCDHGFRHLGTYRGALVGDRLVLDFDDARGGGGGQQVLYKIDGAEGPLPDPPWPAQYPLAGAWRWDATTPDDDGNARDERERWELSVRGDGVLDGTYRRHVTIRSRDGATIACAGAASWSYDDTYVLHGTHEDEHWHLHEVAADPGAHPCLAPTPHRDLDEATAEQLGDALLLEWRGKRRQVLHR